MSAAGLPDGAWPRLHDVGRGLARALIRSAFVVRVHGLRRVPRTGPVVLIANHSSLVEPQLIYGMLPRRAVFLIKEELNTGALGWALRRLGQIPVHRGGVNRDALMQARRVLAGGGVVCVFPEGRRGNGNVEAAEGGAAWLVRASGAEVVPLASRGTLRPTGRRRRFRPRVDVLLGEPLRIEIGRGRQGLDEGTERMRRELAALVCSLDTWREHGPGTESDVRKEER